METTSADERKRCMIERCVKPNEIRYLSMDVLGYVFSFDSFHDDILRDANFIFDTKTLFNNHQDVFIRKYKIVYCLIMRCRELHFCTMTQYESLFRYFNWRLSLMSSFCFVHFQHQNFLLPLKCKTYFDTLVNICNEMKFCYNRKRKMICMVQFLTFVVRAMTIIKRTRMIMFMRNEE